jgi:hypothetical protein
MITCGPLIHPVRTFLVDNLLRLLRGSIFGRALEKQPRLLGGPGYCGTCFFAIPVKTEQNFEATPATDEPALWKLDLTPLRTPRLPEVGSGGLLFEAAPATDEPALRKLDPTPLRTPRLPEVDFT